MASVPTLQSLSAVKAAIMICTDANVKTELFHLPESVDEFGVARCLLEKNGGKWDETARNTIRIALKDVDLPGVFLQMLSYHVCSVIPEIWKWLRYLRFTFNVDHDYGVAVLTDSFFTSWGRVDKRTAARCIVEDETWDIRLRYEIACLFLPPEDVRPLWPQLKKKHQRAYFEKANGDRQSQLVSSWTCHLSRAASVADGYDANGANGFWLELFHSAAVDGSDVAVKYYWPKVDHSQRCQTAATIFRQVIFKYPIPLPPFDLFHMTYRIDGYAEVLSFLVSQMEDHQKVSILREVNPENERTVLLDLLACHCETGFLEMVKVFWSELDQADFLDLFSDIAFQVTLMNNFDCCERYSNCDYRRLLKEFWRQTPFSFKRAAFVWCQKYFTLVLEEDVVKFLLKDATLEEKVAILFSGKRSRRFIRLTCERGNPKFASDLLDGISLSQTEKQEYFRKEFDHFLCDYSCAQMCQDLPSYYKYFQLCLQFEDEVTKADLRKRLAFRMGSEIVSRLIEMEKIKEVETFLQWCFSKPEDIGAFRREFLKGCSPDIRSKLIQKIMECRYRNSSLGP